MEENKKYSLILLTSSYMFGINSINYLYNNMVFLDILLINTFLFITSVNYWKNPTYYIDLLVSLTNIFYNLYSLCNYRNYWINFITIKCVVGLYIISCIYHTKNHIKLDLFWYFMSHLYGSLAIFCLFNGIVSIPNIVVIEENDESYKLFLGIVIFVLYSSVYLSVIYNSNIAEAITPTTYKNKKTVYELISYIASTINAFILSMIGLYHCINTTDDNLHIIDYIFCGSIGYYISDIIYLFLTSKNYMNNLSFFIHHLMTVSMMVYQVKYTEDKSYFGYVGMRLVLAELSVIPLNYTWYLKNTDSNYKMNVKYVKAFKTVFIVFFVFRIMNYSHLIYKLIEDEVIYNLMPKCIIVLTLLNYIWFYKIYQINNSIQKKIK